MSLFKQRYPYAHCTVYKLRKLYRLEGIKLKMIQQTKTIPRRYLPDAILEAVNMQDDLQSGIVHGFRLVYLDECMVTRTTLPKRDWAKKYHNSSFELSKL